MLQKMALHWILGCHIFLTSTVVLSFICGRWPIFRGTFIEKINYFLTSGGYDYFMQFVVKTCGVRGKKFILSVEHYFCEQRNPILQIFYLALIAGIYFLILGTCHSFIPGHYVSEVHLYTSVLAVGVGILLFVLTSFCDPGTVKPENVHQYLSAYPYDNVLFREKECSTCKITKPARSKHCSVCNCCVARFDHHCGWMNNCIGEKNTRFFMGFLLWHLFLCLYGAVLVGLILAGELKDQKVIYILRVYYGVGNSVSALFPHIAQWLLGSFHVQVVILVLLVMISLLLAGFFGYHAYLCFSNVTTNENFKWEEYMKWRMKLQEAKASSTALKACIDVIKGEVKRPGCRWTTICCQSRLKENDAIIMHNVYDKGCLENLYEIIHPPSERAAFVRRKPE